MKNQNLLSNSEIATFCGQTAMILNAGITPAEGMQILLSDTSNETGKQIIKKIADFCDEGESFSNALKSSGVFPDYVVHLCTLGEESGNLDNVMESLASYYEREESISENIRGAVRYPFIMIAMMFLVVFVLLTKVLPIFNQVFIQLGSEMTGISATLLNIGKNLNKYSLLFLIIVFVLLLIFFLAFKTRKGHELSTRFLTAFPLTRGFYEKVAAGRVASGLSMTINSGLDTFNSLNMVYNLVDNRKMREKLVVCKERLEAGDNLAEALSASAIFSNLYSRMITIGFRTGSIDRVMKKISEIYEKETDSKLQNILSILEPTLVIILSLIVGLILLSVILPLMGIMSSIG